MVGEALHRAEGSECCHPSCSYAIGQSELKGEDVYFVEHQRPWPGSDLTEHSTLSTSSVGSFNHRDQDLDSAQSQKWLPLDVPPACPHCGTLTNFYSLYCVFDGHNGVHAAKQAGNSVLAILEGHLPLGCPPPPGHTAYTRFREGIQAALVETIVELNYLFAQRGILAGCTATIVLQVGWLVTSVNLGDSRAALDTGADTLKLTIDHRVATHRGERQRCESMGAVVAPIAMWGSGPADDYTSGVGPLRIWPGGLCLSRAIGDFDVGQAVVPFPHVTQVMLPPTGGRLLVASDGIWDAYDKMSRASGMSRGWSTEVAPSRMIQTIVRAYGGLKDDTTIIIADIMPQGMTFQQMVSVIKKGGSSAPSANGSASGKSGANGGFCCFGASHTAGDELSTSPAVDSSVSVRSGVSYHSANSSVRAGKPKTTVLVSADVAALMGLMPEPELTVPGWYSSDVRDLLESSAKQASIAWETKRGALYARPPETPTVPELQRPSRRKGSRRVAFDKAAVALAEARGTGTSQNGGVRRSASEAFANATAEAEEYGVKFGHYTSGMGTGIGEPSVRAGRVYNSEASVRAGTAGLRSSQDPSVHVRGSNLDGSLHLRASKIGEEEEEEGGSAGDNQDQSGLPPVRVVRRGGSGPSSRPLDAPTKPPVPAVADGDSARAGNALGSIGE